MQSFLPGGAGNVTKRVGLRTAAKVADNTPDSKESAPVLDPTCVQRMLVCSAGVSPVRVKVRNPVV